MPQRPYQLRHEQSTQGAQVIASAHKLRNTRDLRTLLLEMSYLLLNEHTLRGAHIELIDCSLTRRTVESEFTQFLQVTTPRISKLIHLRQIRSNECLDTHTSLIAPQPAKANQEAVLAYLIHRRWNKEAGIGIEQLAKDTGASIPTIYKVLNAFEHCITKDAETKERALTYLGRSDWMRFLERNSKLRSVYFKDISGMPRSPKRLAKELSQLKRNDLAIGGVMGALHHIPGLDITTAAQLDVLVHGTPTTDLSFVQHIDPGLQLHQDRPDTADLVVHFINRPNSLFTESAGRRWGSLPDCMAQMHKAGLTHQVEDAVGFFANR